MTESDNTKHRQPKTKQQEQSVDAHALAVGHRMKELREATGLTIGGLAIKSGVSKAYISRLERGKHPRPSMGTLRKLADPLRSTPHDLEGIVTNPGAGIPIYAPDPESAAWLRDLVRRGKEAIRFASQTAGLWTGQSIRPPDERKRDQGDHDGHDGRADHQQDHP